MKRFIMLFNKVGGKEILRQYFQGKVFFYALFMTVVLGFDKKSLELLRLVVNNKLLKRMRKQYKDFISNFVINEKKEDDHSGKEDPKKIWICWFQGIENAPDLVQKCYQTVIDNVKGREIILITEENYKKYVTFPELIQKKIDKGIISKTHMSDLLRMELLINYGGTWMDSTVFCSGEIPNYMLDSELFLFQNLKPGLDGHCTSISNWFITARQNNHILKLTLALLYEYWSKNDTLVDYFIFHDFFQLALEVYSEEWKDVIPFSNSTPHSLLLRLFEQYDEKTWDAIKEQVPLHKLSYKCLCKPTNAKGTYYEVILGDHGLC